MVDLWKAYGNFPILKQTVNQVNETTEPLNHAAKHNSEVLMFEIGGEMLYMGSTL